jgi:hypothetical protein
MSTLKVNQITDLNDAERFNITSGTAVASTSGTSIDFTGIPSWVKRITVMFNGVSTNGTSIYRVRIGSGSISTSGYTGSVSNGGSNNAISAGFDLSVNAAVAANAYISQIVISNITGNTWVASWIFASTAGSLGSYGVGSIALSGSLDQVRITTVNGTDTFDAGSINILYEA